MSASRAAQKALFDALNGVISAPVYDGVPSAAAFPYVEFGASDFVPDNVDCITGRVETIQIDVWSRNQGKKHPTKVIVDEIYNVLHEQTLTMDDPYACATCDVVLARVMDDPDGITTHGVVQVSVAVECRAGL